MVTLFVLVSAAIPCGVGLTRVGGVSLESPTQVSFFDSRDGLSWRRATAPFIESKELASAAQNLVNYASDDIVIRTHAASDIAFLLLPAERFELSPKGLRTIRTDDPLVDVAYAEKLGYWRALVGSGSSYRVLQRDDDGLWTQKGNAVSEPSCLRLLVTAAGNNVLVCKDAVVRVGNDRVVLPDLDVHKVLPRGEDIVAVGSVSHEDGDALVLDSVHRFVLAPSATAWIDEAVPLPATGGTILAADVSSILFAHDRTALSVHFEDSLGTWSTRTLFDGKALITPERAAIAGGTVALWNQTQAIVVNADGTYVDEAIGRIEETRQCSGCSASGDPSWLIALLAVVALCRARRR